VVEGHAVGVGVEILQHLSGSDERGLGLVVSVSTELDEASAERRRAPTLLRDTANWASGWGVAAMVEPALRRVLGAPTASR